MVFTPVDGLVGVAAMLLFVSAILAASAVMSDGFAGMLTHLGLGLPGFGTAGSGNALYDVYDQLRWPAVAAIACAASIYAALGRWRAGLRRAAPPLVLLLAFPHAWDYAAEASYMSGAWILNPAYSFDPQKPCPDAWDADRVRREYAASPYRAGGDPDVVCRPELRVAYVVEQAAGTTSIRTNGNMLELVAGAMPGGLAEIFVNAFGALAKAFTIINLTLAAAVAGVLLDMYAGLAAAAMPVWILARMVPRLDALSSKFLASMPALLLAPPLTSLVVVAGSSALASFQHDPPAGLLGMWAAAVAVLFLASMLPIMVVPVIRGMAQTATGVLASGVSGAASVASGAITAAASKGGGPAALRGGLEGLAAAHLRAYGR